MLTAAPVTIARVTFHSAPFRFAGILQCFILG
jgi:hypothetical protein